MNKLPKVTYDLDPANLLHEERRDDVAWQNSQTAQEANQVNQNVILLKCVQVATVFVVLEGVVLHFTVDELVLPQVYRIGRKPDIRWNFLKWVSFWTSFNICQGFGKLTF